MEINTIENPWKIIKGPNFYTEEDRIIIEEFNLNKTEKPRYIHLDLMPEPYMGNPTANVIFLFANPGYGKNEKKDYEISGFKNAIVKNLTHSNTDYPFYYLNPAFIHENPEGKHKYTDGGKWILDRTRQLRKKLNFTEQELSKKIFAIQLHPYHSAKYEPLKKQLSVHNYTMCLFEDAVKRAKKKEALIVCARSFKHWNNEYQKLFDTNSDLKTDLGNNFIQMLYPRTVYFTEKNLGKDKDGVDNFQKLVKMLNGSVQFS